MTLLNAKTTRPAFGSQLRRAAGSVLWAAALCAGGGRSAAVERGRIGASARRQHQPRSAGAPEGRRLAAQLSKLTADDAAAGDYLGWSVGISGAFAVAGAYGDNLDSDSGPTSNGGSAYIYENVGGAWSQAGR